MTTFSQITIPPVPQMPAIAPGIETIVEKNISDFQESVESCFQNLKHNQSDDREIKRKKFQKLSELKENVEEFDKIYKATKVRDFIQKIKFEMNFLKTDCQTSSHWLAVTQRGLHLSEVTPELGGAVGQIKVNFKNFQETIDHIKARPNPIQKVRALQLISNKISVKLQETTDGVEVKQLREALKKLHFFAEYGLTLDEKFVAMSQIKITDRDPIQERSLKDLVDHSGRNLAEYFLNRRWSTTEEISSRLLVVLEDRYYSNPRNPPIDLLKSWPADYEKFQVFTEEYRRKWVSDLFGLMGSSKIDNPLIPLVFEYMINLADPEGDLRQEFINKKKLSISALAQVADSLNRFGFDSDKFIASLKVQPNESEGLDCQAIANKMKSELLSKKELLFLAKVLKAEVAAILQTLDIRSFLLTSKLDQHPINNFCQKVGEYFKSDLSSSHDNLAALAHALAVDGEYHLSIVLFSKINDAKINKCKEHLKFFQKIFNPNGSDLRRYMKNRNEKNILCTPYPQPVINEIEAFGGQLSQLPQNAFALYKEAAGKNAIKLFSALRPDLKDEEKLTSWAEDHLFDDWVLLFSTLPKAGFDSELLEQVKELFYSFRKEKTDIKMTIDNLHRKMYRDFTAFKIAYKNYERPKGIKELMDAITSS